MSVERQDWSEDQYQSTLSNLRNDYPGYTDNELYAIWCRDFGLIPVDHEGKVMMDQWQAHAVHDGRHVAEDGFRVSRPLYGRARKAKKGTAKPAVVRRKKAEIEAARAMPGSPSRGGPSERALSLAVRYDQAADLLHRVRPHYHEMVRSKMQLADYGPAILTELAKSDFEAAEMLRELGLVNSESYNG